MDITGKQLLFQNMDGWRSWLQENHANEKEAWLVIKKNRAARPGITYEEAVEEALCFGWIDGITKSIDADTFIIRFTPRKKGSTWSVSNLMRVEKLTKLGKMTEAGMEKVREAQENGEWQAAIRREDITNIPDDLKEAVEQNTVAQGNFEKLSPSQKKQFLFWINSAKTTETRQKRIREAVQLIENNIRLG